MPARGKRQRSFPSHKGTEEIVQFSESHRGSSQPRVGRSGSVTQIIPSLGGAAPAREPGPVTDAGPARRRPPRIWPQATGAEGRLPALTLPLASFKQAAFASSQSERSIFGRRPMSARNGGKKGVKPNRSAITLEGKEVRKPAWRSGQ